MDATRELSERFEMRSVDAATWLESGTVSNVESCKITRDSDSDTLESASVNVKGELPDGYYRVYRIAVQDGVESREPVATFLAISPKVEHDGKTVERSAKGYSPLMEPSRSGPVAGWFVPSGTDAAQAAYDALRTHCSAPVEVPAASSDIAEAYVADGSDSWLDIARAMLSKVAMHLDIDAWGRISFAPDSMGTPSAQRRYSEDSSTVLVSGGLSSEADWYDVPNVVEVTWSVSSNPTQGQPSTRTAVAINDDPSSPVSTVSRGYEVRVRESNPDTLPDYPSDNDVQLVAETRLRELSRVAREVSYEHPYDGGRVGDGVMLDFPSIGVRGPATVVWQAVKMQTGCTVEETAAIDERLYI